MLDIWKKDKGLSLIELVVALALAGIISLFIYRTYTVQRRSYVHQDQLLQMQQNLRMGMEMILREIQMAGFDPSIQKTAGAGIIQAADQSVQFAMDLDMDGDCQDTDEDVTYSLYTGTHGLQNLGRIGKAGGSIQAIIPDVEALGFAYAIDSDHDGSLDTESGQCIWAVQNAGTWFDLDTDNDGRIDEGDSIPGGENTGILVNLADVRAVRIWLLVRAGRGDPGYQNQNKYFVGNQIVEPSSDADAENDHLRMRILSTTVKLRNMGL
jgi:type IV pilus assembly protein PilW